jgi:hypothetical protein
MAVIAGARTFHQVRATVRASFLPVMKVSWVTSPIALAFAQKFLPEHTWVPFFNIVGFFIGTYVNTYTKKKRLEALRKVCPLRTRVNSLLTNLALRPASRSRQRIRQGVPVNVHSPTALVTPEGRRERVGSCII